MRRLLRFVALAVTLAPLAPLAPVASAGGGADGVAAKDPRNFTWVQEGVLAIGGGGVNESQVDWLQGAGFGAIADLRAEHQDPQAYIESKGMAFFDMPIDSASNINATQLADFVAWAREQKAAGRPVYIHCTNGWHRAAAFAVAWEMAEHGESYDEAAREAVARRAGTVMRAVSGLLDHEATVSGKPQLAVVLVSPATRPEPDATMSVSVDVVANGTPAANAQVRVWSEESKLRIEGVTDATGRLTFTYTAPAQAFMDHLYARASLDGFVDGADNVEFLFGEPIKTRGPLQVEATREGADILVRATSNGKTVPVRVIATAPGWTAFESSDRGVVRFPDASAAAVSIRVVSWGSEGGVAQVEALPAPIAPDPAAPAVPGPQTQQPQPQPQPLRTEPPVSEPPAQGEPSANGEPPTTAQPPAGDGAGAVVPRAETKDGRAHALAYAAAGLVGAGVLALYVMAARRRSGVRQM